MDKICRTGLTTNSPTWWQAENGKEDVQIELDLEAEFHVTHIMFTFKTFRPKAMYIEKSYDWGKTWKIMRYFAADCTKSFPGIRKGAPQSLEDVVCQERYSRITPGTKGAVIYRVLPPQVTRVIDDSWKRSTIRNCKTNFRSSSTVTTSHPTPKRCRSC